MPEPLGGIVEHLRLELLVQLVLAVVLGGAVGLERELKGKPAGPAHQHPHLHGGACSSPSSRTGWPRARGDPGRIAAQILTGVGFIGAGTILHMRGAVTGLTSAATIWVVTAIGMALGARAYLEALGATVLVMLVLAGLQRGEDWIKRKRPPSPEDGTPRGE